MKRLSSAVALSFFTAFTATFGGIAACDREVEPLPVSPGGAAASASVSASAAPAGAECRANGGTVELVLSWTDDHATGTLRVDGTSRPVVALLYKGLVLVDGAGTQNVTGELATLTTEGKKTIRIGDSRQPTFDCS